MDSKEWFATWFNTPYYHKLYKHRDLNEARIFLDNLMREVRLPKTSHILDVACGRGRHARQLHQMGYSVTGIDLSEENIIFAGKHQSENLFFQIGDMRQNMGQNKYDMALNLFTSFGYFDQQEENQQVFNRIFEALKPGGIFVFDYLNAHLLENIEWQREEKQIDDIHFSIRKKIIDKKIIKEISVQKEDFKDQFFEQVALLYPENFKTMLLTSGFTLEKIWGDYNLSPFSKNTSNRFIFSARK
ncbi:MAG: class I SAM-dependent methyltransferase [Cryomorphaceae bacterium]|nr:class I SAM-dependent methyltransferase [Cryomorphaceae bacterium]